MEYFPDSYESKLNTLFKHSSKFNGTFHHMGMEGVKYPILIPSTVDENVIDNHLPSSTPPPIPPYPIFDTVQRPIFWNTVTKKVSQQSFPSTSTTFSIMDVVLDLEGNISQNVDFDANPTAPFPDLEKLYNQTVWNVSSIVNNFLTTTTTTTVSIHLENDITTVSSPSEIVDLGSLDDDNNLTTGFNDTFPTTARPKLHIFKDIISPVASTELLITYGFFVIFLAILGIISNSATIHVLFKESINLHIKKHYTNMTILSLAMVNLIASIFVGFGGGLNVMCIGFNSILGTNVEAAQHPISSSISTTMNPTMIPFYDPTNSSAIATIISAYANVSFADLSNFNDTKNDNETDISQIFPSIKREIRLYKEKNSDPGRFCRMQCFFNNLANFVTIWTLAVISADRFFAHNWPLKYNESITRRKFAIFMVYVWLQGITFSSISIELWTRDELMDKGVSSGFCHCSVNWLYIPRNASMGVAFFKLLAFVWMSIFPYSVIFTLNSIMVYRFMFKSESSETKVTTMSEGDGPSPSGTSHTRSFSFDQTNPVNRFFQSNPQQDHMIWRVMPPPLTPSQLQPTSPQTTQYGNPPLKELFSSSFAGSQIRRSRLWELHRMSQNFGGQLSMLPQREATTESVLRCYLTVIFAFLWLHSFPGCLSFLLFVVDGQEETFIIVEMVAFLFKLVGFSINAFIYFWLRKDFHDAFSKLFRQICALDITKRRARTGPQGGVVPGVVIGEEW